MVPHQVPGRDPVDLSQGVAICIQDPVAVQPHQPWSPEPARELLHPRRACAQAHHQVVVDPPVVMALAAHQRLDQIMIARLPRPRYYLRYLVYHRFPSTLR